MGNKSRKQRQNRKQKRRQNKTKKGGKTWLATAGKFRDLKLTEPEVDSIIRGEPTEPLKNKFKKIKGYKNHYLVGITDGKD